MKSVVAIILLLTLIILGILIYRSPDEAHWIQESPFEAIETGRIYAFYLLKGYKKDLQNISIDPAKTKIENSDFSEITLSDISNLMENKKINIEITSPLLVLYQQEDGDMELVMLEKLESFIAMTFAFKSLDKIVEVPVKGKMFFSIALRYYQPDDDRTIPKLIRKTANLPLLRKLTGRMGTTGRWVVFEYNYTYNLKDYFDWVLKEGENYTLRKQREGQEFIKQLESGESKKVFEELFKDMEEKVEISLDSLYAWGILKTETQIKHINKLYQNKSYEVSEKKE